MAGEIVETTRLWARTVGPVNAAQVEEVGAHVIKRTYAEPHWSSRQAAVMASETVSLFGVPIVAGRKVPYARVNPVEAREIFLRSALVEGQWRTRHHFFEDNQQLRAEAAELEERTRRRDLVVDDQVIYDFYDARVPADITSGGPLRPLVAADPARAARSADHDHGRPGGRRPDRRRGAFPDHWTVTPADGGVHELAVSYRFSPGDPRDGVSVEIPLAVLNQLDARPSPGRSRGCGRAGHRDDPRAAQGGPQEPGAGAGVRRPGAPLAGRSPGPRRAVRSRCPRRWPGPCAG